MARSLIWVEGDPDAGWACSTCQWRFPVPTLLSTDEAKEAYDRLAAAKFRDHHCEAGKEVLAAPTNTPPLGPTFADRARALIKKGFKPKDAVEVILQEVEFEHRHNKKVVEKARWEAEDFLSRVRKGLI
jgi:hypothetical protein